MSQSPLCLVNLINFVGPPLGVMVIWQIIKRTGLAYWIRVPRQTKRMQLGQYGIILGVILIVGVLQFLALFLLRGLQPTLLYLSATIAPLIILGNTAFLFGFFLYFMQSWTSSSWVKWVIETYPQHYREILLFASQGSERRKWRKGDKTFEEFQAWVRDYHNSIVEESQPKRDQQFVEK